MRPHLRAAFGRRSSIAARRNLEGRERNRREADGTRGEHQRRSLAGRAVGGIRRIGRRRKATQADREGKKEDRIGETRRRRFESLRALELQCARKGKNQEKNMKKFLPHSAV